MIHIGTQFKAENEPFTNLFFILLIDGYDLHYIKMLYMNVHYDEDYSESFSSFNVIMWISAAISAFNKWIVRCCAAIRSLADTSSFLTVLWFVSIQQRSRSKCGVVYVRVSIAVYLYLVLEVWEHPEYDAWEPSLGATMPCSLSGGISYVYSSGSFMASRLTLSILRVKVSALTCALIRPILYDLYKRHDFQNHDRAEVGNPSSIVSLFEILWRVSWEFE